MICSNSYGLIFKIFGNVVIAYRIVQKQNTGILNDESITFYSFVYKFINLVERFLISTVINSVHFPINILYKDRLNIV